MRILDSQYLVLQKCRIHPLILVNLHAITLVHKVFIVLFNVLIGGMASQLI